MYVHGNDHRAKGVKKSLKFDHECCIRSAIHAAGDFIKNSCYNFRQQQQQQPVIQNFPLPIVTSQLGVRITGPRIHYVLSNNGY